MSKNKTRLSGSGTAGLGGINSGRSMIFGACNPMIDVTARVDVDFLLKYNLLPNNAILGDQSNLKIYDEMKERYDQDIEYTPGGSGINTMRTITWILNSPNVCIFMGSVGKDDYAEMIKEKAKETGLKTLFQVKSEAPTATCAVLLTGTNRSLVAHLGAAKRFTVDFLDQENNWSLIESQKIYYFTGYFFDVCWPAVIRVAKHAFENDRTFCINMSALFITEIYEKEFAQILPYVDILFGNDAEAVSFAKNVLNIQTNDLKKIAKFIANSRKLNGKRKRIVVITRAEKPVIYCVGNKVNEISVQEIPTEKIIDTSCAGDAFVGGFLAQYIKGESTEKCIDCGNWAAGQIIQRHGCTLPDTMDYS